MLEYPEAKEKLRAHTRLAASISRAFVGADPSDLDAIVVDVLRLVGTSAGVEVAYAAVFGEETITGAWEWTAWGGPGRPPSAGDRLDGPLGSVLEAFHRDVVVRIADIPALRLDPADDQLFSPIDARSVLLVPVRYEGRLAGMAGYLAVGRTIDWSDEQVAALRFQGDLIVAAVTRLQHRQATMVDRRRVERIAEHLTDALLFVDDAGVVAWASPSAARVLGASPDQLRGRRLAELAHPDHAGGIAATLAAAWAGTPSSMTALLHRADGRERWFDVTASRSDDDHLPEALVTVRDVHARQLEVAELADLALHDALTGALNRRGLRKAIDELTSDDHPAIVAFIDLDGFKALNDRHGHAVGDEVLAAMAARLRAVAGERGLVARLGGDEFVVIAPGYDGDEDAARRRVEVAVAAPLPSTAGPLRVGASVGLAALGPGDDPSRAISDADAAMYRAKQRRR